MPDELDERTEDLLDHLYLAFDAVSSCGCGWPDEARRLIHGLLRLMPTWGTEKKQAVAELIGGSLGARQIVLAALDAGGLISHGVQIDSADLTDRGRWVLWAVEQVGGIDAVNTQWDFAGFPHSWNTELGDNEPCTEACWQVPDGWEPAGSEPEPKPVVVVAPGVCPGPSCPQYLYGMAHEHTEVQQ